MAFSIQLNSLIELILNSSAVVKVTAFFLVWVAVWLPIAIPLAVTLNWKPFQPLAIGQKLAFVLSLYAIAPIILWVVAQSESAPFSDYGLAWNAVFLTSLIAGICLGVTGVSLLVGFERLLGWVRWDQIRWGAFAASLLPALVLGLLISVVEELVFRGFLVNQLQRDYPLWIGAIGSSLIFALLHIVWEGQEVLPQLPGLWLMGLVLVLARWVNNGNLGLACGLHAGWIWAMTSLDAAQLMRYSDRNPEWITGIAGKPLAGGMGLLLLLATSGVLFGLMG